MIRGGPGRPCAPLCLSKAVVAAGLAAVGVSTEAATDASERHEQRDVERAPVAGDPLAHVRDGLAPAPPERARRLSRATPAVELVTVHSDAYGNAMSLTWPCRRIIGPSLRLLVVVACAGRVEALEPAVLVRDINPVNSSAPTQLTRGGDHVFFTADDGTVGRELWVTDGTEAGTALVRDINPEPYRESLIGDLTWFDGALYFGVGSPFGFGPHGLWTSDGTPGGTGPVVLADAAFDLLVAPQRLFFRVASFRSATVCWLDLEHHNDCADFGLGLVGTAPAVAGDRYFVVGSPAYDSPDAEMWVSDGSAKGFHLLRDIRPGEQSSNPRELTAVSSRLYFVADDGIAGVRLWASDGSASGTNPLASAPLAPSNLRAVAGRLFFVAPAAAGAYELWVSDGTDAGTHFVRRFAPAHDGGTSVFPVGTLGDEALLVANEGRDLWISDGTAAGTRRLRTFAAQPQGVLPYGFTAVGARTVFTACGAQGCEPWITDGTAAGTRQIADVWPGAPSSYPEEYTALGRQLLFSADTDLGRELWKIALPGAPACAGDCDGTGETTIAELTVGVSIVLGSRPLSACASLDADGDGHPSVADLIGAVAAALAGCPAA